MVKHTADDEDVVTLTFVPLGGEHDPLSRVTCSVDRANAAQKIRQMGKQGYTVVGFERRRLDHPAVIEAEQKLVSFIRRSHDQDPEPPSVA